MIPFETKARPVPTVPPPRAKQLPYKELWDHQKKLYDLNILSDHQAHEGRLTFGLVQYLIEQGTAQFMADPIHITIPGKVLIIGDLHCLPFSLFFPHALQHPIMTF